jgi:hypothetical protein
VRREARGWAKQQRRLAARNGGNVWNGTDWLLATAAACANCEGTGCARIS